LNPHSAPKIRILVHYAGFGSEISSSIFV